MPQFKSEFLNILQDRGFIHQGSDLEGLDAKLMSGVQSAYIGFDATAKSLHIGNLTGIMMLKWFQETGHKPITLMGGGTSKVGDPSFKDESRKLLDDATITENISNIRDTCFRQFLKYGDGPTDALMVNNDDWLSQLHYLSFLRDFGRYFTVNRMISFDSVRTRLERESPLTLLEFNYMVMQGYDFYELRKRHGTILQMGGSDQWGNIINGVELIRKESNDVSRIKNVRADGNISKESENVYALTAPLLLNSAGEKMGKTVGGAVWLNKNLLSAYDYWQFWRNVDDADLGKLLRRFTMLPLDEISRLEQLRDAEINEAKKILAFEATKLCHGEAAAQEAAETARQTFEQGGGASANLPTIEVTETEIDQGLALQDILRRAGLVESNGEAKRLIAGGGVRLNDEVMTDPTAKLTPAQFKDRIVKLSSGKKKHVLIKLKD